MFFCHKHIKKLRYMIERSFLFDCKSEVNPLKIILTEMRDTAKIGCHNFQG